MTAAELVDHLRNIGVQLWIDGENLRYRAPQDVFDANLKARLVAVKPDVIALLESETAVLRAPQERFEPFPLTDVQAAYLVGRTSAFRWGGVGCHGYAELAVDYTVAEPSANGYRSAWRKVIDRHDMLRCVVHPEGYQTICPDVPDGLTIHESASAEDIARVRSRVSHELRNRTYRLGDAPMYDLVVTIGPDDAVIHLSIDLLIADFVSISILMSDFERCLIDPGGQLPPIDFSFRDYLMNLARERSSAAGMARRQQDLDYWQSRIDQLPPPPALPIRPADEGSSVSPDTPRFSRRSLRLSAEKLSEFGCHAAEHGVSVNVALMAVFSRVIGRYGDRDHFLLTLTTMDRRPLTPAVNELVGDFTGTSVLEVDVRGERPFAELLRGVGERLFDDMDHWTTGGVNVARLLARRDDDRGEQSPVVFTSTLGARAFGRGGPGSLLHPITGRGLSQTPQVLLDCQVGEIDGELEVNWDTRDNALPAEVLDRAFDDFRNALELLSTDSSAWDRPLLPVLAPMTTPVSGPRSHHQPALIHTGFVRNAVKNPDAIAVRHGDQGTSYGQLLAAASVVAAELAEAGVGPRDYVGIRLPEGPNQVAVILGTLLAGAAYVPMDVTWPDKRIEQITDQCALAALCEPGGRVDEVLADPATWSHRSAPVPDSPTLTPDDIAYVIFTSGSTGAPKGVMMAHGAVVNTLTDINDRLDVGANDSVLAVSQHTFDLSVYNIFGILGAGGTVVFAEGTARTDPHAWRHAVAKHRVTVWNSVPAQMQLLIDYIGDTDTLPSLRRILLSGDWIPVSQPAQIATLAPNASMLSLGGATEAAIWSICHPLVAQPYPRSVPYGTAMRNQSVRVLTHRGEPALPWQIGEIHIGGLGLAEGYLGDPERTAAAFVTHPVSGERLYRTGDYGRLTDAGVIELLGRRDNQVKVHGHRIELAEVDSALSGLDGVHTAVSTVIGHGPHDRALAAALVPGPASAEEKAERRTVSAAVRRAAIDAHTHYAACLDDDKVNQFAHAARAVAIDSMCAALGAAIDAGESVDFDELARRLSLPDQLKRLLRRWIDALVEVGAIVAHPDSTLELIERRDLSDCAGQWRHVQALGAAIDYGDQLLAYVGECIDNLPGLLAGTVDPLALLFPEGTLDTATAAYRDNLLSRYANGLVVAGVTERARRATAARPLRVLEVGAGVGGTTVQLVAALAEHPVQYTFTDVSNFFLGQAAETFADHHFIDYRLFDINRPPAAQGFSPSSFDIVVCANVLHNAINVDEALSTLDRLLAPGGSLVFIDATATNHPLMISMEFKEGLHGFTDVRAGTSSAFLTYRQWLDAIGRSEFSKAWSFPPANHRLSRLGQHVFWCDSSSTACTLRPVELTDHARQVLPSYMVPQQILCLPSLPLTANGKIDRTAIATEVDALRAAARRSGQESSGLPGSLDPMESRIATIWATALGLPSEQGLSPSSDFFALGGDSLVLAQTIGRIRREIGEASALAWDDLLRAMVSDPTLAAAARAVQGQDTVAGSGEKSGAGDSPLVYLGDGPGFRSGTEVVVCIHDGSGGLAPYGQLIAELQLAGDQTPDLYGLRRVAGDGYLQIAPADLFTTLASRYSAAVTALAPAKVHLVGYCMGGLLAAEIARCLEESGVPVGTVTVVSSYRVPVAIEDDDVLDYCFAQIMGVSPSDLGMHVQDDAIRDAFAAARARYGGVIPAGGLVSVADPELVVALGESVEPGEARMKHLAQSGVLGRSWTAESLAELRSIFVHSLRAVVQGATQPFLGDLHFLRQRGDIHFLPTLKEDMTAFWREYCLGNLTVSSIEGNHFDCLTGENARAVATLLAESWAVHK